ncbi:hypothetical protein CAPTEDRAFT_216618 [Capitella teleta]|uniref:Endonuclease/exonuclease/phosphatase domain-containing protein n=1 Tax=Capitella teleta TaxID=283909 RepID=R7VDF1_CAPTE|nr:hypothetical protein CAPTEDRAFT_216618 [Capitella teleta]|eukprot:ELU16873.1 hypothetical protein CAPTEDRAFT_216618 [Capitella teleta]
MAKNPQQKMIVIGDLNARFSNQRKGFLEGKRLPPHTRYTDQRDEAKNPNSNAQYIQSALQELILINGLTTENRVFSVALTYRKGTRWISELDSCLVSATVLPNIEKFEIKQNTQIPSDHAPASLTVTTKKTPDAVISSLQTTLERSRDLGTIQEDQTTSAQRPTKRPIRMNSIDAPRAREFLTSCSPPTILDGDIDRTADEVNATLYTCAETCKKRDTEQPPCTSGQRRWEDLLENNDSKIL